MNKSLKNRAHRSIGLGDVSRRDWCRLEQSARADHDRDTLHTANQLQGEGRIDLSVGRAGITVLRVQGDGWRLVLGEVFPAALAGSPDWPCLVDAAGRYGRWWLVRLRVNRENVTALGSHLRVDPLGGELDPRRGGLHRRGYDANRLPGLPAADRRASSSR